MAASGEKPYRVYRGGRTKGKVPLGTRERDAAKQERTTYRGGDRGGSGDGSGRQVVRRPRKGWTWKRWTWVTLVALVVLLVVWGVAGYFSVRSGVKDANARLAVGTAVLEVSEAPHTGCKKFAARFGLEALRFFSTDEGLALNLRGINTRIVEPGTVRAGDAVRKL